MTWKLWGQVGTLTIDGQQVRGLAVSRNDETAEIDFVQPARISFNPAAGMPPERKTQRTKLADFTPDEHFPAEPPPK
jgi:hypothetical protein